MSSGLGTGMGSIGSITNVGEASSGKEDVVPVGFDEAVLRALCDMDVCISTDRSMGMLKTVWTTLARRQNKAIHRLVQGELNLLYLAK